MRRSVLVAAFVFASPMGAFAQAPDASFTDAQREGLRLFSQSCGVCHTPVQQRARQYGPVLSSETLGGDEEALRDFISTGTPRMPGFRFTFEPPQIDAVVQYLKTIPPQPTPASAK
jgi:mono/diheme cytochrome c family protein